jgi:hypothetical protein
MARRLDWLDSEETLALLELPVVSCVGLALHTLKKRVLRDR